MGSGENAPVLKYGSFLTAVINFLIIAMIIFLIVRAMNKINESIKAKLTDKEEVLVETTKVCPYCREKEERGNPLSSLYFYSRRKS